jgi:hypothetical protein
VWWHRYAIDSTAIGGDINAVADGFMAFPSGDFFWERAFEIWVLTEVGRALAAVGAEQTISRPLYARSAGPVEQWRVGTNTISIWFQRQRPLGDASWRYDPGGPLSGVPDVTLTAEGRSPLVIDAKFRFRGTDTRSEETYKMLGYAENFRQVRPFAGVLVFPGRIEPRHLTGPAGGRVSLVSAVIEGDNLVARDLRGLVMEWAQ